MRRGRKKATNYSKRNLSTEKGRVIGNYMEQIESAYYFANFI